jgi:hypothetical protein
MSLLCSIINCSLVSTPFILNIFVWTLFPYTCKISRFPNVLGLNHVSHPNIQIFIFSLLLSCLNCYASNVLKMLVQEILQACQLNVSPIRSTGQIEHQVFFFHYFQVKCISPLRYSDNKNGCLFQEAELILRIYIPFSSTTYSQHFMKVHIS